MSFRTRLRPLKRGAGTVLTALWSGGLAALAFVSPLRSRPWQSPGGQRVLVLAPHPDDEAIGCGGTVLCHLAAGDEVCIAIATDGRKAGGGRDPVGMSARRHEEAKRASQALGPARLEWLALHEGDWAVEQLQTQLSQLLNELQPDLIYAPSRVDFHPEHHRVAHALALALDDRASPRPATVRIYQIQVPLTGLLVNLVSDLRTVREPSEAVLRAYESQAGTVAFTYRRRRYSALRHGIRGAAEEFWELPAERYAVLHREPPQRWSDRYRGFRAFALTDPLAWLVGRHWRRQLAAAASRELKA